MAAVQRRGHGHRPGCARPAVAVRTRVSLGWLDAPDHGHLLAMVRNPITKLVVLVLVVLALFHAAHRFRFVLDHGLQLGRFDRVIALWCYGMAVLGSATAGWMLLTM